MDIPGKGKQNRSCWWTRGQWIWEQEGEVEEIEGWKERVLGEITEIGSHLRGNVKNVVQCKLSRISKGDPSKDFLWDTEPVLFCFEPNIL